MSDIKRGKFCHNCRKQTMHESPGANHLIHFVMTIITGGVWLMVWIWACVLPNTFRCSQCGAVYSWLRSRAARSQEGKR